MIGWPENGVYLDSSWRHKNDDANLPLTLMVTSRNPGKDEGIPGKEILRTLKNYQESGVPGHMTPGAVLISENVREGNITRFIQDIDTAIHHRSAAIIAGDAVLSNRSEDEKVKIIHGAHQVNNEDWSPEFWMIDHASAELNEIKRVKKDSVVQCCQFHIVQAISE